MPTFDVNIFQEDFHFITGSGLFSPNQLDARSRLLLEEVIKTDMGKSILDIGCGYGAIGTILAKKYPSSQVTMIDSDPKAIALAKENPGQLDRGDVQRLYRHALKQNPGNMPFVVIIDVNVPQTPDIEWEQRPWIKDIDKISKKGLPHGPTNPDPCTVLVYTNFSFHYQTSNDALPTENLITRATFPKFPIVRQDFIARLTKALPNYGNVPNLDVEVSV